MKKILMILLVVGMMVFPVQAMEFEPPVVPDSGELYMPDNTESFAEGLLFILR